MKALGVLALATFCACNANILWPEPKSNLDVVKDAFWDHVAAARLTAGESLEQIRQSELGQEMNARISQSVDTVNRYIAALQGQVAPLKEDFMSRFSQEAEQLKARLEKDLATVSDNMQPYMDMVSKLQEQVEELRKETAPYAEAMDPEALKAVLLQRSQELKAQLAKSANELQVRMVPSTETMARDVERRFDEFQKMMLPLAQNFETQLIQKAKEIQQSLAPLGEELRAKLDARSQELKAQLAAVEEMFGEL
ncbi:apolipoprotein A-IV-like [Brachionichthys hirsutus]|uniref:apolipoprotein A-IV-like n=1 Tax=Brachionichthys hirsutus TaxID=412623 RepID=UPI0036045C0D